MKQELSILPEEERRIADVIYLVTHGHMSESEARFLLECLVHQARVFKEENI